MRSYDDARSQVGTAMEAGNAGGRTRWLRWESNEDGAVSAVLFKTPVVTFYPTRVEVRTGGYVTPTTFDGIATALGIARWKVGTIKRVPYVLRHRMSEGMWLDYDGRLLGTGSPGTPLGPTRTPSA